MVEPLALPAFELGYRWYRNSGGLRKHKLAAEQNVSYATYKQQALARQSAGARYMVPPIITDLAVQHAGTRDFSHGIMILIIARVSVVLFQLFPV